jgi:hypothetical protein
MFVLVLMLVLVLMFCSGAGLIVAEPQHHNTVARCTRNIETQRPDSGHLKLQQGAIGSVSLHFGLHRANVMCAGHRRHIGADRKRDAGQRRVGARIDQFDLAVVFEGFLGRLADDIRPGANVLRGTGKLRLFNECRD